jgi:Asp-tRNA(Asn)/Glu-tRNA(Gln) amidotransferase A subunit family amidase
MLSALELARRIEAGTLRPRAVVELCAEAIAAHENDIGAFAALGIDAARQRAEEPQRALLPLRGLPIGVKDIFDTAELPTAYGSPIYAGHRPKADAAMVMLIQRAGGLVLGKTVTTEFASLEPAPTRNPRNRAHTPGGSSSGSAAAVAAGMLPLALGSQTGGSVIRPAAFCGVAGFKPSYRLLPTVGMKCFSWSLDTVGLFGASVPDIAFAAAAMSGRDLRVDGRPPAAAVVALVRTPVWHDASTAMQRAVERAARAAERSGARIKDLDLPPIFADAMRAHRVVRGVPRARVRIRRLSRSPRSGPARTARRGRDHRCRYVR